MNNHQRFRMNMNDMVYVRFTDLGYQWLAEEHNSLGQYILNWAHKTKEDFKHER